MTSLVIDIGNTLIKIAVFKLDEISLIVFYKGFSISGINGIIS